MTIPKWHEFLLPILQSMHDGVMRDRSAIAERAADTAGITAEDRRIVLTTGQPKYANRIGWALSHLTLGGALDRPSRGQYVISAVGRSILEQYPNATRTDIEKVTGYRRTKNRSIEETVEETTESLGPAELIDRGIQEIHAEVAAELLTRLHAKSPAFFEEAVVKLLVAMGYGGAEGNATVTQQTNDGGIDGVIDQDALGLQRVYVQAKRYAPDNPVARPELQGFVGALSGVADRGIFITTGRFTSGARQYAESAITRIILIDGPRLASLMIRYGVGVQTKQTVQIVEIDEDFFE